MRVIRWMLVPVAALGAWGMAVVIGVILHDMATRLCPESYMVSGACVAPWWPYADAVVLFVSAAIAAASIMFATCLTAPSHRPTVAVVVFAAGFCLALFLAVAGAAYIALPGAGIAGGWALWWIRRRYR